MPVRLTPRPAPLEMLTIRPQPRPLHAGRDGLRAEEGAGEVDVEDGLPVGLRDLLERPADLAAHAAGIVDQDVDRPPSACGLRHEGLRPRARSVTSTARDVAAARAQCAAVSASPSALTSQAQTPAPRAAKAGRWRGRSRAPAPVTIDRAAVEGDVHAPRRDARRSQRRRASQASGRRPSSISWISSTSRAAAESARRARAAADRRSGRSGRRSRCLRLRTARSRQMPLWRLGRAAVEGDHVVEASAGALVRAARA